MFISVFFFFSSRRRHTRLTCDWSSDVCSSDLINYRRREQSACGRPRPPTHKFQPKVQEPETQQCSGAAKHDSVPCRKLHNADGDNSKQRQQGFQRHDRNSRFALGQDQVTCSVVVFAVHPCDCHEMWELPKENDGVKYPCLDTQTTRGT